MYHLSRAPALANTERELLIVQPNQEFIEFVVLKLRPFIPETNGEITGWVGDQPMGERR